METVWKYGREPFRVVVIHGGPGALGSVAPIARQLGQRRGVLEPLQTAVTLDGQVEELRLVVEQEATPPVIFIGHSWGCLAGCPGHRCVSRPGAQTDPGRQWPV